MATLDRSLLASLDIFKDFGSDDLDAIVGEARIQRIEKDAHLFEEGADAHSFYVVVHGHLRVVKLTLGGDQVVMRYIAAGEICGVASAMGRTTYPATSIAAVDSIVLAWPSSSWERLAKTYPALASAVLSTIGSRLQDAHSRVIEMSTQQVEGRIAHALLRLVQQAGRKVEDGVEIDFPISRLEVAQMTGSTLHTVSRILSNWEGRGLVSGGRQRIVLRDPHRLLLIAESVEN